MQHWYYQSAASFLVVDTRSKNKIASRMRANEKNASLMWGVFYDLKTFKYETVTGSPIRSI